MAAILLQLGARFLVVQLHTWQTVELLSLDHKMR